MKKTILMARRIVSVFLCFTVVALICFCRVYLVGVSASEVNNIQNGYTLSVGRLRGTVFDCNMRPITNNKTKIMAAVLPTPRAITAISSALSGEVLYSALEILKSGKPALVELNKELDCEGIIILKVPEYVGENTSCEHLIGYLGNDGHGVSGIEKAYDEYLYSDKKIEVIYPSDALGNFLVGDETEVVYDENLIYSGVSLTIDLELQRRTEEAMRQVKSGAAVVMEVSTGKIRAMVSAPRFDLLNVGDYLNNENSPLVNRALSAYNVGSVFKPCVAAALIESGANTNYMCNCSGSALIDSHKFNCHKLAGHGNLDLAGAISESCNVFFYKTSTFLGAEPIYKMAKKFSFSSSIDLGGISTASGSIDSLENLKKRPTILANLAIGQGELLLSPVSILTLYEAIANEGVYSMPTVVEGVVEKGVIKRQKAVPKTRAMSKQTADKIKEYLLGVIENGTGRAANPYYVSAAGKTATAETGWRKDGRLIQNSWFCGFFPYDNPKYVVSVLIEDEKENGTSGAPIFKKIVDDIALFEGL